MTGALWHIAVHVYLCLIVSQLAWEGLFWTHVNQFRLIWLIACGGITNPDTRGAMRILLSTCSAGNRAPSQVMLIDRPLLQFAPTPMDALGICSSSVGPNKCHWFSISHGHAHERRGGKVVITLDLFVLHCRLLHTHYQLASVASAPSCSF